MFLIGLAFMLFGYVVSSIGGNVASMLDSLMFLVVLIPVVGVTLATGSAKVFVQGLKAVILPKSTITEEAQGQAASLFRLMSKTLAITGAVMFLICAATILNGISGIFDFSNYYVINMLGMRASSVILGAYWSLLYIVTIFEPAVFVLKRRHTGKR